MVMIVMMVMMVLIELQVMIQQYQDLLDLMDSGVAPTVPRTRLVSIRELNAICQPAHEWPAESKVLVDMATGYFKGTPHQLREVRL